YDYDAKYTAGKSHHIIPARIPETARASASDAAERAFTELGCSGMARVDIIVDAAGTPWVLEVHTVPGLTELSLLPDAARAAGIAFYQLCQRLVDHAVGRHDRHVGPPALLSFAVGAPSSPAHPGPTAWSALSRCAARCGRALNEP